HLADAAPGACPLAEPEWQHSQSPLNEPEDGFRARDAYTTNNHQDSRALEPGAAKDSAEFSVRVLLQMKPRGHSVEKLRDVLRAGVRMRRPAHVSTTRDQHPVRLADVGLGVFRVEVLNQHVAEDHVGGGCRNGEVTPIGQPQLEISRTVCLGREYIRHVDPIGPAHARGDSQGEGRISASDIDEYRVRVQERTEPPQWFPPA